MTKQKQTEKNILPSDDVESQTWFAQRPHRAESRYMGSATGRISPGDVPELRPSQALSEQQVPEVDTADQLVFAENWTSERAPKLTLQHVEAELA